MIKHIPERYSFTPEVNHWISFNAFDQTSSFIVLTGPHCLYEVSDFDPGGRKYHLNFGYSYGAPQTLHPIKYGSGYLTPYAVPAMFDDEITFDILSPHSPIKYTKDLNMSEWPSRSTLSQSYVYKLSDLESIKKSALATLELDSDRHYAFLMEKHFAESPPTELLQSYGTTIVSPSGGSEVYNGKYWTDVKRW